MEQDKISCSILFSMFWGQIGVKIVFSVKMQKNSAVKQRVYGTFWKRTSQMIQCTPTKQKECVLHPTPLKFSAPIPSHLSKQT